MKSNQKKLKKRTASTSARQAPKSKRLVFSNLATSLDGHIAERNNPSRLLGTPYDRQMMKKIRQSADVVIFGAATLRAHPFVIKVKNTHKKYIINAVVSKSGDLDPSWDFWKDPEVIRFVFTTKEGFRKAAEACGDRAFVVETGSGSANPQKILEALERVGAKRIWLEGGGEIMQLFLEASCLDEMYLTLTPWLIGGAANPSLVTGANTLSPWRSTQILSSKKVKNEIYLHLKVLKV